MKTQYLRIGEVVKPQGVRGEIKLRAESEDESRYARLKTVYVDSGGSYKPLTVLHGRAQSGFAYLQIEGISDRDKAEKLRGAVLYVSREDAIVPREGQYFICDLLGCRAEDENGKMIGRLVDIQSPNAYCDVYIFETESGEMSMPAVKHVFRSIDIDGKRMVLDAAVLSEIALWPNTPGEREDEA